MLLAPAITIIKNIQKLMRTAFPSLVQDSDALKNEIANTNELLSKREREAKEREEQLRTREQEARDALQQREREIATTAASAKGDGDKHAQQLLAEKDRALAEREQESARARKEADAVVERAQRLEAEAADLRSQLKQKAEDNERLTQLLSAEQQKSSAGASGVASSGATGTHTHTHTTCALSLSFFLKKNEREQLTSLFIGTHS